jgi:hypothetical protein
MIKHFQSAIIVGLLCVVTYQRCAMQSTPINEQKDVQKTLSDGTTRSSSSVVDRNSLDEAIQKSGIDINGVKKDNSESGFSHRAVVVNEVTTAGSNTVIQSTEKVSVVNENGEKAIKESSEIIEEIGESRLKIGTASFTYPSGQPWNIRLYPKKLRLSTIISENDDGMLRSHNKITISVGDEEVVLPIETSSLLVSEKAPKLIYHPGFKLMGLIPLSLTPSVGMSGYYVGYGSHRDYPDFTFLNVGLAVNGKSELNLFIAPVDYRVGKHLSFMKNTYVTGGITLDSALSAGLGVGLAVKF